MDKRLSSKIANASVFAAMMVVGIHTVGPWLEKKFYGSMLWCWESWGYFGVFLIAVPFFFCCSGYFLAGRMEESGWYRRCCGKRTRTLFVPYLVWCLAYALLPFVVFFLSNLVHGRLEFMPMDFGCRFWVHTFGLSPFQFPKNAPLWYLRTLMFFVIISPVLRYIVRKWGGGGGYYCYISQALCLERGGAGFMMITAFCLIASSIYRGLHIFAVECMAT